MKRAFALLLSLVLVLCLLPAPAVLALSDAEEEDPAAFYLIGDEADSFSALYDRMCVNLRLKKQPLPEPDTEGEPFNASGEHEFVYVLKDDDRLPQGWIDHRHGGLLFPRRQISWKHPA